MPKGIRAVRGRAQGPVAIEEMRATRPSVQKTKRQTPMQLGCSQAPPPSGAPTDRHQMSKQKGIFHFIVNYVNFTNKPNTARNTEQIKC